MGTDLQVIFGPPGTGKTTELARLVGQYVEDEGSNTVLLTAFTKAAARELAARGMGLEAHQIGTLHSHCFHALDNPPLAEKHLDDWNKAYPSYELSEQDAMDPGKLKTLGDQLLAAANVARHNLRPESAWPSQVQLFWRHWKDWKAQHGYSDFTDWIEMACELVPVAPGNPRTLIIDEAQDLSLLQWKLIHRWGQHADRVIAGGDDEQCLYRWAGADFQPLLDAPHRRVLPQSYRVPQAVQAVALGYSAHIHRKEPKTWHPRPIAGAVHRINGMWEYPERWVPMIQAWLEEPFGTYGVLASCGYMLTPFVACLRQAGIPFSNKWRRKRRDWNPLAPMPKGVTMVQRLLDFCRPSDRLWTWYELAHWIPLVQADGLLVRGAKNRLALHADEPGICALDVLQSLFLPGTLEPALHGGLAWLESHVLQSQAKGLAYPLRVLRTHGAKALTDEPRLTIGTKHSTKGAEMDVVINFAALSRAQEMARCSGGEDADDIYRMLYVGATRAKETLYLVGGR